MGGEPLTEEGKQKELDNMKRYYGKSFEYIDEYQFKYVMDLKEVWNDNDKKGGFNLCIYDLYDEGCYDEGLFYYIEEID